MDQIFIKDLLVRGVIGITEAERSQPQDILINVVVFTDTRTVGISDKLEDTVNYRTMAKSIIAHTEKSNRHTVEALAADIARLCLQDMKVERVRVKVEKPGAVRFSRTVGVEIERLQEHPQDNS
jgi:FolB domain-containing protein